MFKLYLLGVDDAMPSAQARQILQNCSFIYGSQRFADLFDLPKESFFPLTPLQESLASIEKQLLDGNVAVLASGDPLFYGIGRRILTIFTKEKVTIYPALSAIQRAAALFATPWDDARIISLHGRSPLHPAQLVLGSSKSLIFTDNNNTPATIAATVLDYLTSIGEQELQQSIHLKIAENIGLADQRLFSGSLEETNQEDFSPLNVVLFEVDTAKTRDHVFGLKEDEVCHSRGLITKDEVRAVTLHKLQLPAKGVFWDIGAGSGSISIEAARLNPELTIYAIERRQEELANIKRNIRRYKCFNIIPVAGTAPKALAGLPRPDRIFFGGSGGKMDEILAYLTPMLEPGAKVVINGVTAKTISLAPSLLKKYHYRVASARVSVTRTDQQAEATSFNPITIVTGEK